MYSFGRLAAAEKIEYKGQDNADDDAGYDREVEAEVFLFDVDVAWQFAQPGYFGAEVKHRPDDKEDGAEDHQGFA
jgi:hypothetical protein